MYNRQWWGSYNSVVGNQFSRQCAVMLTGVTSDDTALRPATVKEGGQNHQGTQANLDELQCSEA